MNSAIKFLPIANPLVVDKSNELKDSPNGNDSKKGFKLPPINYKKWAIGLFALLLIGAGGVAGHHQLQVMAAHQDTDDAYITGHMHQVSTRVPGTVTQVLVDDNDHVKAGQVIAILDKRDYAVKVAQAQAALDSAIQQAQVARFTTQYAHTTAAGQVTTAEGSVSNSQADIAKAQAAVKEAESAIDSAKANVNAKQAEVVRANGDLERFASLSAQGAVSKQEYDNARRDATVAQQNFNGANDAVKEAKARLEMAKEAVNLAKAQMTKSLGQVKLAEASGQQTVVNKGQEQVAQAAIEQAKATLDEAKLNLSYAQIVAPATGRIGKKTVEVGQRIDPGQPLMTVVSDETWIVANFKETQLENIRPGQTVEVKVDSFPNHKFEGVVQSYAPGSGSSFALLPSDNATGNFTKIVQRVPVKILFTKESAKGFENLLVPGMSVVVDVTVKSTNK